MWARAAGTLAASTGLLVVLAAANPRRPRRRPSLNPRQFGRLRRPGGLRGDARTRGRKRAAADSQPGDHRFLFGGLSGRSVEPLQTHPYVGIRDGLSRRRGTRRAAFDVASRASGITFTRLPDGSAAAVRVTLASAADANVSGGAACTSQRLASSPAMGCRWQPPATSTQSSAPARRKRCAPRSTCMNSGHVLGLDHVSATDEVDAGE